jgi:hypothetical protein
LHAASNDTSARSDKIIVLGLRYVTAAEEHLNNNRCAV